MPRLRRAGWEPSGFPGGAEAGPEIAERCPRAPERSRGQPSARRRLPSQRGRRRRGLQDELGQASGAGRVGAHRAGAERSGAHLGPGRAAMSDFDEFERQLNENKQGAAAAQGRAGTLLPLAAGCPTPSRSQPEASLRRIPLPRCAGPPPEAGPERGARGRAAAAAGARGGFVSHPCCAVPGTGPGRVEPALRPRCACGPWGGPTRQRPDGGLGASRPRAVSAGERRAARPLPCRHAGCEAAWLARPRPSSFPLGRTRQ